MKRPECDNSSKIQRRSRLVYLCFICTSFAIVCQLMELGNPQFSIAKTPPPRRITTTLEKAKDFKFKEHHVSSAIQTQLTFNASTVLADDSSQDNGSEDCPKPRDVIWEWIYYSQNVTKPKARKRLLIALYSGYGKYSRLLELTAPVNRAYARRWEHDMVILQGAAMRLPSEEGCEPPAHRATFNKIPILQLALTKRNLYDQLLIIDTDAMLYDMKRDITTILPQNDMMAAQSVHTAGNDHTWDVNAGVTLWDLHHPKTKKLAKEWDKSCRDGIMNEFHPSNDQFHMHKVLREGNYTEDTFALKNAFKYTGGTMVRHFIRKNMHKGWEDPNILDDRENTIDAAAKKICERHYPACLGIEMKTYSA